MTLKIERDKQYVARDGSVWRVVCTDRAGHYPVIAYRLDGHELWSLTAEGHLDCESEDKFDLIREYAPKPKKKKIVLYQWLCRMEDGFYIVSSHTSSDNPGNYLDYNDKLIKRLDNTRLEIEVEDAD